jgi:hypothetical protein
MSGKGDKRRPQQIEQSEADLRWELISSRTSQERKEEILAILEAKQCTQTQQSS